VRRLLLALLVCSACSGGDDDTLTPLPVEGGTPGQPSATSGPASGPRGPTTPRGLPAPTADPAADPTASAAAAPTGDWDGARFDVGTIEGVGTVGAYTSIELDRWSYTDPDGRTADAAGLTAEPLVGWWRESPFSNLSDRLRTFVLAPDVEVLVLDPARRAQACAGPPGAAGEPVWEAAGSSALDQATADGTFAVITYADSGLVARLRLTRGC
jgi:hypothetical protein